MANSFKKAGRKDITQKISETMKPNSQKTTTERAGEYATNAGDSVMGSMQPNSEKSGMQKMQDQATQKTAKGAMSGGGMSGGSGGGVMGQAENLMKEGEKYMNKK